MLDPSRRSPGLSSIRFSALCGKGAAAQNPCETLRCFCSLASIPNIQSQFSSAEQITARKSWRRVEDQRAYFDQLATELRLQKLADWYNVTRNEVERRGGKSLFYRFKSLGHALQTAYPEYKWDLSKFDQRKPHISVPFGYWKDKNNLLKAIDDAEARLGLKQPEDWCSVTMTDLVEIGFPTRLSKTDLAELLTTKYPSFKWERVYLLRGRFSQQKRLERTVASLFPGEELKRNVRKEAGLLNPVTKEYLELDIYLPSLRLAFEYQERHHYDNAEYAFEPLESYKHRDMIKRQLAKENGITIITVPFWWDGKSESLILRIHESQPLLVQCHIERCAGYRSIPEEMPEGYLKRFKEESVEDIGKPMTACFLTDTEIDPTNWWLFEKYDGVRGFWNPVKQMMFSRHGKPFRLPPDVINSMPQDMFLDGELWFGRDNFLDATKIANRMEFSAIPWKDFKYMVFDVPNHRGTYAERYNLLDERFGGDKEGFISVAQKQECQGLEHMEQFFQDVIDKGGEGIILRNPASSYTPGRSKGFLKHKKFRDAEARVIQQVDAHQWECELPNGVTFLAAGGTTEFVKRWKPQPGDIVSFKHRGYLVGSKKPKYPLLFRARPELSWSDVVASFVDNKSSRTVSRPLKKSSEGQLRSKGFWRERENRRKFLLEFAESKGFDPLVASNWLPITTTQIKAKGGRGLLVDKTLKEVLSDAFPEFQTDVKYCRSFFDEFAKKNGFDPLKMRNWYSMDMRQLQNAEGGSEVKLAFGGWGKALRKAYPELHFGTERKPPGYWKDPHNCREFFIQCANELGFDPLNSRNWEQLKVNRLLLLKPGTSAIQEQNGGLMNALLRAFPDLMYFVSSES